MPKLARHFMKYLKFGAHFYTNCLKLWISRMKNIEYEFYRYILTTNEL